MPRPRRARCRSRSPDRPGRPRAGEPAELSGDDAEPSGVEHLDDLVDAWLRCKRITIEYWHPGRDETETRQVDVYGWARRRGEWIFVGHCHKRDAVRIFYLSRVRKLSTPVNPGVAACSAHFSASGRFRFLWRQNCAACSHDCQSKPVAFRSCFRISAR